jgi:hypothetical protein
MEHYRARAGMPYQVRTGGHRVRIVMGQDQHQIEVGRWHHWLGLLGLIYIVLGTVYQIIANWV